VIRLAEADSDIDLLLITGAGASCEFGSSAKDGRLVLMPGWCDALVSKLAGGGTNYLQATGLSTNLAGPEFELRLGRFLRAAAAFKASEQIVRPSVQFQSWQWQLNDEQLASWHMSVCHHLDSITSLIHETLYEEFGPLAIDSYVAKPAYEWLFDQMQLNRSTSTVVVATTNYDVIAETVLEIMGRQPDFGAQGSGITGEPPALGARGLLDGMPRYTPVLHLHGRVGWYERENDVPRSTVAQTHQAGYGAPVVVLPDPEKQYETPLLNDLWHEFEEALTRAKKVFVMGHSLCDEALVDAIAANVAHPRRVAVGWLSQPGNPNEFHRDIPESDREALQAKLPGVHFIPFNFGREPSVAEIQLRNWHNNALP
jgi:hypothetical protein